MENIIEIRHYVGRAGKDVFDEWLTELADARAQAKIASRIHSYFNLDRAAMTERMLAAIENPYTQIIAHPTGRLLLRRDPIDYDMEKVLGACAKHGVAMECNSYPDRLDSGCARSAASRWSSRPTPTTPATSLYSLRRHHGPARLARKEGCHQHPANGAIPGEAPR